jgi:hypothetical protein
MFKSEVGYSRELVGWAMLDFANRAYRVDIAKVSRPCCGLDPGNWAFGGPLMMVGLNAAFFIFLFFMIGLSINISLDEKCGINASDCL